MTIDPRSIKPVEVVHAPNISQALGLTIEECAEVIQVISKINRFGWDRSPWKPEDTSNAEELERELGDVFAMMEILSRFDVVDLNRIRARAKIAAIMDEPYRAPHVRRALLELDRVPFG